MTRPQHEYTAALALVAEGLNDCAIGRRLGIPYRTINNWRHGIVRDPERSRAPGLASSCPICEGHLLDAAAYSYLLGLYLGDGHIATLARCERLSIYLDDAYPGIIDEAEHAIAWVHPIRKPIGRRCRDGCTAVMSHWKHWSCLFPQHGRGPKHKRPIVLRHWQEDLVSGNETSLLRGLIHSDGCRAINRVRNPRTRKIYAYPRYQFTNEPEDIKAIFANACDALGVHWTRTNRKTISVSRKRDVAFLDGFIGPKN